MILKKTVVRILEYIDLRLFGVFKCYGNKNEFVLIVEFLVVIEIIFLIKGYLIYRGILKFVNLVY